MKKPLILSHKNEQALFNACHQILEILFLIREPRERAKRKARAKPKRRKR
jgi:hypothetical protein